MSTYSGRDRAPAAARLFGVGRGDAPLLLDVAPGSGRPSSMRALSIVRFSTIGRIVAQPTRIIQRSTEKLFPISGIRAFAIMRQRVGAENGKTRSSFRDWRALVRDLTKVR